MIVEPAIVALQDAAKNSRQSDIILENSPKGDSHIKRSSSEHSEGSRRNDTHVEDVCRGKLKAVTDNKHVFLPWLVVRAGVSITRYKTVHDGKTAHREDQAHETKQQDATVWRKCRLDDAEAQSHNETSLIRFINFGVFVCIVPRTEEFVVLILKGAVLVRAVHRLSEDRKRDTEFMSNVKGSAVGFQGQRRRRHQ